MIKMENFSFDPDAVYYLDAKQKEINSEVYYKDRVIKAKDLWSKKSGKHFLSIRETLTKMCVGARRCNYCEDSVADEVEHVKPKNFYPESCFVHGNYLYSCGPCNGPKNDKFAVIDNMGNIIHLSRKKGGIVNPPPVGMSLFIDPRVESPLDYIVLDLVTFFFVPKPSPEKINILRADYTIKTLGLNTRDYLVASRKNAYSTYLDSLDLYVKYKKEGLSEDKLKIRMDDINHRHHPTVWLEMKRQHLMNDRLKDLFLSAPELLN